MVIAHMDEDSKSKGIFLGVRIRFVALLLQRCVLHRNHASLADWVIHVHDLVPISGCIESCVLGIINVRQALLTLFSLILFLFHCTV